MFKPFKIVRRNKKTGAVRNELWYSPELKQWVRIRENLDSGLRVRELTAFKLRWTLGQLDAEKDQYGN
jgi:hypothetical protein